MSTPGARVALVALMMRYPIVILTVVWGLLGGAVWLAGFEVVARWGFGIFALVIAGIEAVRMIRELRQKRVGIDILAIIAILATVAVGEVIASMIIVLMVSGGKALEDFAQGRAQRELSALLRREPQTAHRVVTGSSLVDDISATDVAIGDVLLVRSGEVVPVDGTLTSTTASFDESSLTGESLPRNRREGDTVLSGSVNGNTAATIVASALAENSQYQAIVALVKQASTNRAPVVRLADRYAIPFTVVSLLLAGAAWALSGDPVRFAEVLVLATPCPLLLAAPVAFMGGMSRAAHEGIIVKGGGVLEQLARARTAVFDKTGTLTHGVPTIARIDALPPLDEQALLVLVASAEQFSSHVLAASIVTAARERGLTLHLVTESSEVAARGVVATVNDRVVAVGTLAFIRSMASDAVESPLSGGELAIYVALDGQFAGSIIATDAVRTNAVTTIEGLRSRGVARILMLTGDAQATADHVADVTGITEVQANCLPIDKVNAVKVIQQRPVIMVGDGVNDSPVLASAEVGIAMGARGASAASEAASAVILVDDISRVERAVEIGQDTVRIALQSIWLGIGLSLGLMVIAALGYIPATLGAGIQEVVDLATIFNALRALRRRDDR
ncbi:heavy metal translocating P-type ATPase [Salinibacterium sp. G-O1]|uniref:heavy metal translocating P-type ATPase n=1 Tax=Salinibacterium sp. G-O1 TaxID=3046208 RepID=UPI0024BB7AF5|nr:heavy metal translocating P-type ATPase [Salinibacterium sp. G-O1]MDJ0336051.1 heavy metal translocating P-type ATPase [Salinibacterium sp. G-O1]